MHSRWPIDDIIAAGRRCWRRKWHVAHIVLVLGIGIGCVTGLWDVARGAIFRPLPYREADRIAVAATSSTRELLFSYHEPSPRLDAIFESAAEYQCLEANLDSGRVPRRIQVTMVSPQFFATLGVRPELGRDFTSLDFFPVPGSEPQWLPIILDAALWHSYFGSRADVLNRSISLNIPPYHFQVIGVAPPNVNFPFGTDAWVPIHLTSFSMIQTAGLPPSATGAFGLLKVGLSISAAEVQIRTWTTQRTFEKSNTAVVHFVSLRRFWAGAIYPLSLTLLMISLLFLALIIAATVTMFRVDIETRQAEFALRTALGANSRRLLSLLFFETAIIVLAGVTVSLSLSSLLIHLTVGYLSLTPGLYGTLHGLDIAVALGASLATVIIAVAIQRVALSQSFRHQSVGYGSVASSANVLSTATKTIVWPRLPIQPMLVTVIVVIAMLLVRSAYRIRHLSLGVRTDDTFVCEISMFTDLDQFVAKRIRADASTAEREMMFTESSRSYHEMMNSSLTEVLAELAKSPSVRSAGVISTAPYRNHQPWATDAHVSNGRNVADRSMVVHNVAFRSITPDVIPALGMTLVYGRGFTGRAAQDRDTVIINRAMADKLGSWSDAMAQYIELATLRRARVVGIVNNVYEQSVQEEVWPTVYFPFSEYGVSDVDLVVRTRHDATGSEVARLIDRSLHSVDERAIASHFARLSDMVESAGTLTRYTAAYLFALAIVSVFLAGFCTSAAILADFHGRRREVGIRLALGATAFNIVISFVLGSLLRNGISMVLGVFLAWSLSRLLSHLVLDVGGNFDLGGYIIAVSALAGYILTIQVVVMGSALQRTPRDLLS